MHALIIFALLLTGPNGPGVHVFKDAGEDADMCAFLDSGKGRDRVLKWLNQVAVNPAGKAVGVRVVDFDYICTTYTEE